MLSRLFTSIRRDNLIVFRANFYFIQLAIGAMYVLAIMFLVPESAKLQPTLYVADETADGRIARMVKAGEFDVPVAGAVRLADSKADLDKRTRDNENSIGVLVTGSDTAPTTQFFMQGNEKERVRALLTAAVADRVAGRPTTAAVETDILREESDPITFRQNLVPFLLFVDFAAIGALFAVTMIFAEKDDGVLAAYRVTPGRTWEYLVAKAASVTLVAVVVSLLVVALTIGSGVNYLGLVALVAIGSWASTMLGLAMALRFRSFEEYFMPMVVVGQFIISLPAVMFIVPSFRPGWLMASPFTKFMFGLREAVFPSGNTADLLTAMVAMGVVGAACLWLGVHTFHRQLARA